MPAPAKYVPVRTTITNSCYAARYIKDQSGEKALAYPEQRGKKRANFTILIFFSYLAHASKKMKTNSKKIDYLCNSNID